jgi:hypothetical protein
VPRELADALAADEPGGADDERGELGSVHWCVRSRSAVQ